MLSMTWKSQGQNGIHPLGCFLRKTAVAIDVAKPISGRKSKTEKNQGRNKELEKMWRMIHRGNLSTRGNDPQNWQMPPGDPKNDIRDLCFLELHFLNSSTGYSGSEEHL